MTKRKISSPLPNMPKESRGRCVALRKNGTRCRYEGILADGLCLKCWDKSVGYKDDLR